MLGLGKAGDRERRTVNPVPWPLREERSGSDRCPLVERGGARPLDPAPRPVRSRLSCQKNQARLHRVPSLPQAWAPHPLPASSLLLTVWLQVLSERDSSGPRFPAISQCAAMCSVGRRQSPPAGGGTAAPAEWPAPGCVCRCLRAVLPQEGLKQGCAGRAGEPGRQPCYATTSLPPQLVPLD